MLELFRSHGCLQLASMLRKFSSSSFILLFLLINSPNAMAQSAKTVSPADSDATVIQGINTAGTVKVNNLACLEGQINMWANGLEILGIWLGLYLIIRALTKPKSTKRQQIFAYVKASVPIILGLINPSVLNWLTAAARDAQLFS